MTAGAYETRRTEGRDLRHEPSPLIHLALEAFPGFFKKYLVRHHSEALLSLSPKVREKAVRDLTDLASGRGIARGDALKELKRAKTCMQRLSRTLSDPNERVSAAAFAFYEENPMLADVDAMTAIQGRINGLRKTAEDRESPREHVSLLDSAEWAMLSILKCKRHECQHGGPDKKEVPIITDCLNTLAQSSDFQIKITALEISAEAVFQSQLPFSAHREMLAAAAGGLRSKDAVTREKAIEAFRNVYRTRGSFDFSAEAMTKGPEIDSRRCIGFKLG